MKPEDILALLPSGGDKPAVTVADGVVTLTYTVESHAARVSLDDIAIRERYAVLSAEQEEDTHRGGDGRLISVRAVVMRYSLAPKPPPPQKTTTRNG